MQENQQPSVDPEGIPEVRDFSLVLGGPLYQLLRRARLGEHVDDHLLRRALVICGLAWLPLLVLAWIEGTLIGGVAIPFLADIETHVRFLVAVPLLVIAELLVHLRMRGIVAQFLERRLIAAGSMERFQQALKRAMALRNSTIAEVLLVLAIVPVAIFVRGDLLALDASTWYAVASDDAGDTNLAGSWYWLISNPLLQFLALRWYFRIFVWMRFLWQVSRIELDLVPTHPDRNAGLGFLGASAFAIAPLLTAHGAALAGYVANRIFHEGAALPQYQLEVLCLVAVLTLVVIAPLCVFAPKILEAKRRGLREYGLFATQYLRDFDRRWLRTADHDGETMLGTADIQSLADLGNAYTVIREVRGIPFGRDTILVLVFATVAPIAPLLLTMIPFEELLTRLVSAIF
ncbi:MAG: hypothetical protein IPN34_22330 [Planctomycetes bacterium]|nr:hypothetical protein [Planctomycetota bacterium]